MVSPKSSTLSAFLQRRRMNVCTSPLRIKPILLLILVFSAILLFYNYSLSLRYLLLPKPWQDIYSNNFPPTQPSTFRDFPTRRSAYISPKSTYLGPDINYLVASPLCLGHSTQVLMTPVSPAKSTCFSVSGQSTSLRKEECSHWEDYTLDLLGLHPLQAVSFDRLEELEALDQIKWLSGTSVLANYDHACENIAHWAKASLAFRYLRSDPGFVGIPGVDRVLMFMDPFLLERWDLSGSLQEEDSTKWNWAWAALVSSLGTKDVKIFSDFNAFLGEKPVFGSIFAGTLSTDPKKIICFEQVVISGAFRNNLFLTDEREQLSECSSESILVPKESLSFRKQVFGLLGKELVRVPRKRFVYLKRDKSRRAYDDESERLLLELIQRKCDLNGYDLEIHTFQGYSFSKQLDVLRDASVFMSLHGAGLTNSIFMAPFSVLFEVFPYGWFKQLYQNGMESGLKYYHWNVTSGEEYLGVDVYKDHFECVTSDYYCRRFYRDRIDVYIGEEDIKGISMALDEMFVYLEEQAVELFARDCYKGL